MRRMRLLERLITLVLLFLLFPDSTIAAVKKEHESKPEVLADNKGTITQAKKGGGKLSNKELDVIQLDSRNFGKYVSGKNVWLIEFYSPNCGHCVEFAPTYSEIARHYHGNETSKIKVGKVNGEKERALTSRFGIYAYPTIFIVDGWSVYEFEQARIKKFLMDFAEGGYKKTDAVPFYSSPMGPLGLMQAMLIATGHGASDFFGWAQKTFGLSPLLISMFLFGSMFLGCFFLIVFLALVIPPRHKQD